ncbi:shikimate dehydrogenase [Mameliella sp. AT18]|uniref:shikimate dehydrogenase n=1 Tax=Mameliella sp. AT18 TaxID=3028385 RepID=UPI0008411073|nr:shikimate dehydrogenase [Mameliella sp. AT18]MDD9730549.1 shikimate dehydrogenase [Mameliella sp. AT18]ODM48063.1 shikimate dehydrogenase [Ruegeria sp. PBVC088]
MTDRYVVFGNPLGHSKSPLIHARFAAETGQDLTYGKVEAPVDGFEPALRRFIAEGGKGCNVTAPFKLEAFALADKKTPEAAMAGAANTLRFADGGIEAHNTDGYGLLADVERLLCAPLAGKRVLMLGAGGAARGAVLPFLDAGPDTLVMINRTPARAQAIRDALEAAGRPGLVVGPADTLDRFDVVINATAASLTGDCPALPPRVFDSCALAYDLAYAKGLTPFLARAREAGVPVIADGVGMLVGQAAVAFDWWRGVRPATRDLIAELTVPLV